MIRLGTVIRANQEHLAPLLQLLPDLTHGEEGELPALARRLTHHGFESFQFAWKNTLEGTDLDRIAAETLDATREAAEGRMLPPVISCLGLYGNTLDPGPHGEEIRAGLRALMAAAPKFGTSLVCCFAGRVTGASIPDSIPRFRAVFSELTREAGDRGLRLALENCPQGGTWERGDRNIAHNPDAWQLLFNAVPSPALGLQWEPAHQRCQLIDPLPQLRDWTGKIFHLHGKDAQVDRALIARHGVFGAHRFAHHRFPGLGETNWAHLISALQQGGFTGCIDIEGGHDPVYRGPLELQGQLFALRHLRQARP